MQKKTRGRKASLHKRAIAAKLNPHINSFANVSLIFKQRQSSLERNEFEFIVASAIQTIHGEFAGQVSVLSFKPIDSLNYNAIIRYSTSHHARVVTALLLFGQWQGADCKFEIVKTAITPCLLTF